MHVFVRRALVAAVLALLAASIALPAVAPGERVRSGNLVLSVRGEISPIRLPRDHTVPVAARLTSGIASFDGQPLPRVRQIEIAFGGASIAAPGLPVCPRSRLRNATAAEALERCGASLVGRGRLSLEVRLRGQRTLRRSPRALVFNGRIGGEPGLWIHAFTSSPPISFVLPFRLRHQDNSFPTVLVASLPRSVGRWVGVTGFQISLRRTYRQHGRLHSYLSASCPVPRPLTAGFFPLAKITYRLAGERQVSETLVRSCHVR